MSPVLTRRSTVGPSRPAIRLRPPPELEPPFDDELPHGAWAGPGAVEQLRLDWQAPEPAPPPTPRPAGPPGRASAESWTAVRRFMALCLEIFNGYRPTGHVRMLTAPAEVISVVDQLTVARDRVGADRSRQRPTGGRFPAVGLRRLLVCEPHDGVAEAAAVLESGGRTWAMALRLERHQGRWRCTAARTV
jgi:hypothetical protein